MRGAFTLAGRRVTRSVLLVLVLVVTIAMPGAVASAKRPKVVPTPAVPSCATVSRTAILQALRATGPLTLESHIGNMCIFEARSAGDYLHLVSIQIEPYSYPNWFLLRGIAKNHVAAGYHYISPLPYQSTKSFHLLDSYATLSEATSQGMAPCDNQQAQTPLSQEVGPRCAPQPPADTYGASGVGDYKSSPLELIVTVTESGLPTTSPGSGVNALVTGILTGSIH